MLLGVFRKQPRWEYYQGFHDIASLFLTLFPEEYAFVLTYKAGGLFFRDALNYSFDKSMLIQISLVIRLIQQVDPAFHSCLREIVDPPIFAVPWVLTWFVHAIQDTNFIVRLYDYLLSSPPQTVTYLCTAFIYHSKTEFMNFIQQSEHNDMGHQFQFFTKLFSNV